MENLNKTQKIAIAVVGGLAAILIIIYFCTKDNTTYSDYSNLYIEAIDNQSIDIKDDKKYIAVYVAGEVNNPSVVKLEEGARVVDAIESAGGLTDSGEIKDLNLAYKLIDGEKLYIPSLDEVVQSKEENIPVKYITSSMLTNGEESTSNNVTTSISNSSGVVNINTCTQTELETLNGIGPSTAKKIIDYRKENGKYKSIEDIKNVSGIGDAKYEGIKNDICV